MHQTANSQKAQFDANYKHNTQRVLGFFGHFFDPRPNPTHLKIL